MIEASKSTHKGSRDNGNTHYPDNSKHKQSSKGSKTRRTQGLKVGGVSSAQKPYINPDQQSNSSIDTHRQTSASNKDIRKKTIVLPKKRLLNKFEQEQLRSRRKTRIPRNDTESSSDSNTEEVRKNSFVTDPKEHRQRRMSSASKGSDDHHNSINTQSQPLQGTQTDTTTNTKQTKDIDTTSLVSNVSDNSDNSDSSDNSEKIADNKSTFAKIINISNKKITNEKLFIASIFIALGLILSSVLGGFIPLVSVLVFGVVGCTFITIINYCVKQEIDNSGLGKIPAKLENLQKDIMKKDKHIVSKIKDVNPIKYLLKKDKDEMKEKIQDPATLNTKDKALLVAKFLSSPIMGIVILIIGITTIFLIGEILAIMFVLAFTSFCVFKGILEYSDYRLKKQKFLEQNKDIPPAPDTNNPNLGSSLPPSTDLSANDSDM